MAVYKVPGQYMYKKDLMKYPSFPAVVLDRVPNFKFYPEDVLVATYPKSGTTWLEQITWLIMNDCDIETSRKVLIDKRSIFLELSYGDLPRIDVLEKMEPPRLIKTHLPYEFFNESFHKAGSEGFKAIVGLRNVKDVLVSFYHFYRMSKNYGNFDQSFEEFFKIFKAKSLIHGDYFDHVLSWWEQRSNSNLHFVKYEDLRANPKEEIAKIAHFLGKNLKDDQLDFIIDESSFESMRKNPMTNNEKNPVFDTTVSKFFRKGEVGDWQNYFTEEQRQYVDSLCKKHLTPHGLEWTDI